MAQMLLKCGLCIVQLMDRSFKLSLWFMSAVPT
jgi:hypothetical protein